MASRVIVASVTLPEAFSVSYKTDYNCQFLAFVPVIYMLPDNGQNVLDICALLRKDR